ncbi:MAG: hypothetical protein LBP61_05565 [Desulfovibrio sp.]|nr:hypothetical protein [Desulfovibrio sp.]
MEEPRHTVWIREHALEDSLWDAAYARLDDGARSRLKLCIARLHALWGERPLSRSSSASFAAGFAVTWEQNPAPYALILCPTDLGHPDRLLAACLPPLLAGVDLVLPWFLVPPPGAPRTPLSPLLAALELAGLEQVVLASGDETLQGLVLMREALGAGRILFLGPRSQGESFVLAAYRLGVPCLALTGEEGDAPLLDSAHEGVWIWPDLAPEWFCRHKVALEGEDPKRQDCP